MENSPVRISIFRTLDLNPLLLRGALLEYFLGNIMVRINSQLLGPRFSRRGAEVLGGSHVSGDVSGAHGTLQSLLCLLSGFEFPPRAPASQRGQISTLSSE